MIHIDENVPVGEVEQSFPYRDVVIRQNEDPKNHYQILPDELGRGKYGTVFLCKDTKCNNFELAAKFINFNKKKEETNIIREIEIMNLLKHPRLIQIYDAFLMKNNICVILELILGGELFERVIDDDFILTEKSVTIFIRQILEGIKFIHKQNIIHLDMKPENILCLSKTGNRIKIIDFGLARYYDPNKKLQVCFGTPEFAAPEVVNFDQIGFYTDMWSIGVICYVLLSGLSPFMGENDIETMTNVTLCKYDFNDDAFKNISTEAIDFITKLLNKNTHNRLTAKDALEHKWLIINEINQKFYDNNTNQHLNDFNNNNVNDNNNTENILIKTKIKLKRYVIKKRWIKAVNTIIALKRMGAKIDINLV